MSLFISEEEESPSEQLLNAASLGRTDLLIRAIKNGGDVNYIRLDVCPSLICAMREYTENLEVLMQSGARGDLPNRMGWSAIHEACLKEDPTTLQILLRFPEQVTYTVQDKEGKSALWACMHANRKDNAEMLVSQAPDVLGVKDNEGNNPVAWAVQNKNTEWLEWFLRKGASANEPNEKGITAANMAMEWDEGKAIIEKFGFEAKEAAKIIKKTEEAAEPVVQEEAKPLNPFGLGGVSKKKMA